jgi:uroporphyrinogen-III synthase
VTDVLPLAGYTIAVTAARRRAEFGAALARHGAQVIYGPAIRIVPLADDTELRAATERCLTAPLDLAIATTGIGFRGWLDAAETWRLAGALHGALARATILARGPKARGAVRAGGLREAWSPESESSAEVLDHLLAEYDLAGKRVAVQLHGEPLPELVNALRGAGADVIEVPVYRWVPPEDGAPLRRVVEATAAATLDCVTFTSAPAATNFLHTADQLGLRADVRAALQGPVLAAAVGSVTAAPLVRDNVPVTMPDRYRLGALVRTVVEQLRARAVVLDTAGHRLQLRGHAVVLDGTLIAVPAAGMALLRALAARPGQVLSHDALGRLLPGESSGGHAVEVAMSRLRAALGDPRIIQTVVKRGYRLAADLA